MHVNSSKQSSQYDVNANAYNINSPAPPSRRKHHQQQQHHQQYQQSPSSYSERPHSSSIQRTHSSSMQTTQQPPPIFSARGVEWPLPSSLSVQQYRKYRKESKVIGANCGITSSGLRILFNNTDNNSGWIVAVVECSHPPNFINNMSSSAAAQQLSSSSPS